MVEVVGKRVVEEVRTGRKAAEYMGKRSEDKNKRKMKKEKQRTRDLIDKNLAWLYGLPARFSFRRWSESMFTLYGEFNQKAKWGQTQ